MIINKDVKLQSQHVKKHHLLASRNETI